MEILSLISVGIESSPMLVFKDLKSACKLLLSKTSSRSAKELVSTPVIQGVIMIPCPFKSPVSQILLDPIILVSKTWHHGPLAVWPSPPHHGGQERKKMSLFLSCSSLIPIPRSSRPLGLFLGETLAKLLLRTHLEFAEHSRSCPPELQPFTPAFTSQPLSHSWGSNCSIH